MDPPSPPIEEAPVPPIEFACPFCHSNLKGPPSIAGSTVNCPKCKGRFQVPLPVAQSRNDGPLASAQLERLTSGVRTPILVSAIANIVVGLIWMATCFGIIFTIPMVVLCIFEFRLYSSVDEIPATELAERAGKLAIYEFFVGLFNTVTLVCGFLVLINSGKLQRHAY